MSKRNIIIIILMLLLLMAGVVLFVLLIKTRNEEPVVIEEVIEHTVKADTEDVVDGIRIDDGTGTDTDSMPEDTGEDANSEYMNFENTIDKLIEMTEK